MYLLSFLYHHKKADTCDNFFLFPHREFLYQAKIQSSVRLKIIDFCSGNHYILNYKCSPKF